ncbi:MAG TPA: transcriptional repressor LexA [Candidatus Saccharimonadales bacterium]|nr:transcriptional repressor LexA [Candidatus Saccharimonadales bacterium]
MPLTKRQKEILDYVTQYIELHGYAPSYREIAEAFKLGSVATVAEHVDTLISKGLLRKNENEARSLQLVSPSTEEFDDSRSVGLPIMGLIAAGQPIETISGHAETLEVPPFMVGRRHSYVLQVRGESMKDAGIMDGDYVVIQEKPEPSRGDMIVALVNGEATLKRYYKEADHIRLQPENQAMDPIIVKPGTPFEIQGICIGVIRKY